MMKATKILKHFYKCNHDIETNDLGKEKIRIIEAAAKIIKSDKKVVETELVYPSLEDKGNIER